MRCPYCDLDIPRLAEHCPECGWAKGHGRPAPQCLMEAAGSTWVLITLDQASARYKSRPIYCRECRRPVVVKSVSRNSRLFYFDHVEKNPECSYGLDGTRRRRKSNGKDRRK